MNKEMSLYLDLIRFVSAFLVFVYHSFGNGITGGFLWQIGGYGHTAVMVFFVLSGYVIAYVIVDKRKNASRLCVCTCCSVVFCYRASINRYIDL